MCQNFNLIGNHPALQCKPLSLGQMMTCLDIFRDVRLLDITRVHKNLHIRLTPGNTKADLTTSQTMQRLLQVKES